MKLIKIVPVIALLVVGLWMAPEAQAGRARNRNTGWRSRNRVVVNDTKTFDEDVIKIGGVANVDIVGENTGGNNVDGNTGGTNDADSGNTTAFIDTFDAVNYSTVNVGQADSDPEDSAVNETTGAGSRNSARVTNTRRARYSEFSMGGVLNVSVVGLNTGDNSASRNTGGGNTIDSGNALTTVLHSSDVNGSDVVIRQ